MAYTILTEEWKARLLAALAPRFLGRDQDHLLAFGDALADINEDKTLQLIQPLQLFDSDLQSPNGASLVGVLDNAGLFGGAGSVEEALTYIASQGYAPIDSPVFTGTPQAPTPLTADNSTRIATTAFVKAQGYTNNTGTVTSVGITPGTGLSVTGSPITTSGNFSLSLSANLQAWSAIAPSSKADDSAVVHLTGNETKVGILAANLQHRIGGGYFSIGSYDVATYGNGSCRVYWDHNNATLNLADATVLKVGANAVWHSGNFTPTAKADDSSVVHLAGAETITGVKTFNVGANWGAAVAASPTDTSRHIQLHSSNGGYGFSITANTLNIVAGTTGNIQVNPNNSAATSFKFGTDAIFYGSGWNNSTGYLTINPGNAANAGYLAWFGADNVRRGYFGWGAGDNTIQLKAESTYHVNFVVDTDTTNWPTINGDMIGFRNIPRITTGLVQGKMYAATAGFTISTGSAAGSTYSVYNDSAAAITIAQGAGLTMRKAGTTTTGNLTLAARGFATIWFNSTTECIVSGNV